MWFSSYLFIISYILIHCWTFYVTTLVSASNYCNEPLVSSARLYSSTELTKERSASSAGFDSRSSWTASQADFSQYLVVDLGKKYNITSLATKGKSHANEYIVEFRLDYGYDGKDFSTYRDKNGNIKIFEANNDDDSIANIIFEQPLVAQFLRINPMRWENRISMRLEVYGCGYSAEVLGFEGNSMVLLDLRRRNIYSYEDHIQFRFKTSQADGYIVHAIGDSGDVLSIQLNKNKLVSYVNLGDGPIQSFSTGSLLDDNIWHDVSIDRYGKNLFIMVDRILTRYRILGDFLRLNLNQDFWIGGVPSVLENKFGSRSNFSGCLENLLVNGTNIATELKEDAYNTLYQTFGSIYHFCLNQPTQSLTFMKNESYFTVEGYQMNVLNCSLDIRTFVDTGVLLYSKFSVGESLMLHIKDGKLVASVQGETGPLVHIEPIDKPLNDGSWHSVQALLKENSIIIVVDGEISVSKRKFKFQSGRDYYIGGTTTSNKGYIGCMRALYIEGRYVSFSSIPAERMHKSDINDIILDACQMIDKCHPNPCEHGGICHQNHLTFSCDCANTGYLGAVCHVSRYPPSCESYKIENPDEREKDILIDVDGSGPLDPILVTCKYSSKGPTQTIIHHKNEDDLIVRGFDAKGSFVKKIDYNASVQLIRTIIDRSSYCSQYIRYSCINSKLFSSGNSKDLQFNPNSWWVGATNQKMDYWGGSLPGSGMCACGLDGSCRDPSKSCNCDTNNSPMELNDEGYITQSVHLPVTELHVGDTGLFPTDNKQAKVYLGPLVCEKDSVYNDAVTFQYQDSSIIIPQIVLNESGDIYIQFKTTVSNAALLHGTGLNATIKLSLINEKSIQFLFTNGRDTQPLTVEATYKLNDNNWHSIMIERNKKETRLVVDGQISANLRSRLSLSTSSMVPIITQLLVGAQDDFRDGFVGCITSLLINGQSYDLSQYIEKSSFGVVQGCHGKCDSNPCHNKGVCKEKYYSFTCDCQWTAYKGPICKDEIGANLRADNYIRYDFDTSLSTVEETIRVGFMTTTHRGLIVGITSHIGEYMNLLMSTSGHLKLEFDFGFGRKEQIINQENFALGQFHDLTIKRMSDGSKLLITVDNYEPTVFIYKVSREADAKFDQLKSIFIGRNNTMDASEGFVGCISHVSFDDNFPIKAFFQETKRPNVYAYPFEDFIREDSCGIEPSRMPLETLTRPARPFPSTPIPSKLFYIPLKDIFILLIGLASFGSALLFVIRYKTCDKGDYETKEDIGARKAYDPDTAVIEGVTGPIIEKKREYKI